MKGEEGSSFWMFSAEVHHLQGILIVEVSGEIDISTVPELSATFEEAVVRMDGFVGPLVLDLSGVSFMECRGLEFLVEQNKWLLEHGGELRLVLGEGDGSDGGAAGKLLRLAGLEEEFAIYSDTESTAGASRRQR